jgi:release factor glutamine methyltransferase
LTGQEFLTSSTVQLEKAGIATARLDCLVLLEDALGENRAYLLAHPETVLQGPTLQKLKKQIKLRGKHIPLAQIRGKTEFYGRDFIITKDVLEPRPESETMIELLKTFPLPKKPRIADIGTGSGAIGITAALEIPDTTLYLTDIDPGCLRLARKNAKAHAIEATFLETDLTHELPDVDIILANLPYVPDHYEINQAALNEPKTAIFGGPDGLDLYRRFFTQLSEATPRPMSIMTESLPFQHSELQTIAKSAGYKQMKRDDFIQVYEVV